MSEPKGASHSRARRPRRKGQGAVFSPGQLAARAAALPVMSYPDLPVSAHKDQIAEAIRDNQVVIVAGETGSGKTTQLPKIAMEIGRGIGGMIGHTQPRRIAARAVAERIAEELGSQVGAGPNEVIGYQVRFTDEVGPTTLVKLMTDGILLAEIGSDPLLTKYDTIIVDEAHERSLNIDFILGYLGTLLPKRPDLKVIITSATIDSQRFADHFAALSGGEVPVIEVSGRAYPVEVRYRPLSPDTAPAGERGLPAQPALDGPEQRGTVGTQLQPELDGGDLPELGYGLGEDVDLETALCEAVDELLAEPDGDVLVFLPGERDIREAERTLADHLGPRYVKDPKAAHRPDGIEIVPLYARLSAAEQHRIYAPHSLRRIVLATNIAETSLTVPGIRYVIDSGLARISRFSNKTKVQRLPIERVSQASAAQRAGRAGRTSPGIAIRLFSERDHLNQSEFTEPEIMRTSLAAVILQMSALGLGSVADFPFLDRPNSRAVRDGVQLLVEIGALDQSGQITKLGRRLSRLPIDPRLGRMLIEADKLGCASEVLVIVAALSIQDVRERPLDRQEQSDQAHARFADRTSDFITYLNMWRYLSVMARDLSGSAFRRMCKSEYFHYLRYREWRDIVSQIRRMCQQMGIKVDRLGIPSTRAVAAQADQPHPAVAAVLQYGEGPGSVGADEVHRAVLSGLLSNVGNWDEVKRNYQGARGTRFTIWPGSALRRRTPAWVMAAELVETSRLFARTVAAIKPEWIEEFAGPLLKKSYSEPVWSRSRGSATVKERVSLYGLTLAADRAVPLTQLGDATIGRTYLGAEVEVSAARLAYDMFISNALVEGDWRENHHAFVKHNQEIMEQAADLSNRLRDPALVPDESVRFRFFEARVPRHITSAAAFNRWWKDKRRSEPHLLDYTLADLLPAGALLDPAGFPDVWRQRDLELPVSYSFDPGARQDGVTVTIPLRQLQAVRDQGFDWLVPGLRRDLAVALVRGLPKAKRRLLAPAAQNGEIVWQRMVDEAEGRAPQSVAALEGSDEPEVDPYSLEASLDRLRASGLAGRARAAGAAPGSGGAPSAYSPPQSELRWDGSRQTQCQDADRSRGTAQTHLPLGADPGIAESPGSGVAIDQRSIVGSAVSAPGRTRHSQREPFLQAFARAVRNAKGIELGTDDLRAAQESLPSHLRVGFRVVDDRGAIVGASDSLNELQARFRKKASSGSAVKGALAAAAKAQAKGHRPHAAQPGTTSAASEQPAGLGVGSAGVRGAGGTSRKGQPPGDGPPNSPGSRGDDAAGALLAAAAQPVALSADEKWRAGMGALAQMLLKELRLDEKRVTTRWTGREALLLAASPYPDTSALVQDAQRTAMEELLQEELAARNWKLPLTDDQYDQMRDAIRDRFEDRIYQVLGGVIRAAEAFAQVQEALQGAASSTKQVQQAALAHAKDLYSPGYLTALPAVVRQYLPRYLLSDARRIEAAGRSPRDLLLDRDRSAELEEVQQAFREARERIEARPYSRVAQRNLEEMQMLIEELRVSLFAQALGTAHRVSSTRLLRRLDTIERDM